MVRSMMCWWFAGLVAALASPIASAGDDPAAEIAALGGRALAMPPERRSASI